ncbi:hypothetical protein ANO11243_013870 [Dothideomycetidae sp. 11243]|nr:hypothetical protein ANO11243_013870 [fungal sp. No.11243]
MDIEHVDLEERRLVECQEPSCTRKFTKKGNMLVHYRSAHEQKKFTCGEFAIGGSTLVPEWDGSGACGRGFATKASLEKHVRTQHLHLPLKVSKGKEKRKQRKARMAGHDEATEHEDHEFYDHERPYENQCDDGKESEETRIFFGGEAATMLTGVGYERVRHIPCVLEVCQQRFKRTYDLELHLQAAHGFNILAAMDAAESAQEMEALSGGQFWVGGDDDEAWLGDEGEDVELASRLAHALGGDSEMMRSSYE